MGILCCAVLFKRDDSVYIRIDSKGAERYIYELALLASDNAWINIHKQL